MNAKYYYDWTQDSGTEEAGEPIYGYLSIDLAGRDKWDLLAAHTIEHWSPNTQAYLKGRVRLADFPFTDEDLPVYSPRLRKPMDALAVDGIQYLPLRIRARAERSGGAWLPGGHLSAHDRLPGS